MLKQKGKMNRGLTVLHSVELLSEGRELTRADIFKSHLLGWCIEMVSTYKIISHYVASSILSYCG